MAATLETNDLILRPADMKFAESVLRYYRRNQAFLEPFEPKRDPAFFTYERQEAALRQEVAAARRKSAFRFYIWTKADPQTVIGRIGLSNIVWGCFLSCFLSYNLDAGHTNQGYMTQAVTAVSQYAFQTLRLHRIEANVMPRNRASRRVLEKCGFREEGVSKQYLKINGVWEDHVHMVLLNETE
jgi:[ribosomal protein S5]-alanine N-acetyltransferase